MHYLGDVNMWWNVLKKRTALSNTKEPWQIKREEFESSPDIVYHGAKSDYEIETDRGEGATGNPTGAFGAFFTPYRGEAQRYVNDFHGGKGVVLPAKLQLKNPYYMPFSEFDKIVEVEWQKLSFPEGMAELRERVRNIKHDLVEAGHDGIIVGSPGKMRSQEIIVFNKQDILQHKYQIMKALSEGKEVPKDVLEQYPELLQSYT